jgi:hypothetical protein
MPIETNGSFLIYFQNIKIFREIINLEIFVFFPMRRFIMTENFDDCNYDTHRFKRSDKRAVKNIENF